jgi:acetyl esterase
MDGSLSPAQTALGRAQGAFLRALLGLPAPLIRALAGRPLTCDGQRLDPEAQLSLRLMALNRSAELKTLTPPAARRRVARDTLSVGGRAPPVSAVESVSITGGEQPLRGRLYDPGTATGSGLLVYFHGGGFVVCDLDTHDHTCRLLALASGARVLSVDYRLAPEHRFPAAAQDAWTAFAFAADRAAQLGADPARLAVGGDSAGGNLAAGVAQHAVRAGGPAPALQLLLYPWLDLSRKRRSYALFGQGFYLSEDDLDWYTGQYLDDCAHAGDPRCSPLLATELAGVAPAFIATAGFDPLRDEGEEYAMRLRAAGVPAALQRHAGLFHGFANAVGVGRAGREAVLAAGGALRLALA